MSRPHKTVSRIAPQVDRAVVTYYPAAAGTNAISPRVLFVGTSHIPSYVPAKCNSKIPAVYN